MATSVTARAPAWADGVSVTGAEMRAAVLGSVWATAGLVNGLRPVQIPTPAMQIRVPAGRCVVSDGAGGMMTLELLTQTDLDIAASSPTQPRIDSLIAEFVDNGASSIYRFRVLTGTPAASPSAPSLPAADQPTGKTLRIANIAVAANVTTIVQANISLQTTMALSTAHNGLIQVASDGARPTEVGVGASRYRPDKACTEVIGNDGVTWYDQYLNAGGPPWPTYTPTWTTSGGTAPVIGNGSRPGRWMRIGRTVHVSAKIIAGTTTTFGTGQYTMTLPIAAYDGDDGQILSFQLRDVSSGQLYQGQARTLTGASNSICSLWLQGPNEDLDAWSQGGPVTLGNGDIARIQGSYEVA